MSQDVATARCTGVLLFILCLIGLCGTSSIAFAQESNQCTNNLTPGENCPVGDGDVGSAPGGFLPRTSTGNPIDLITGVKTQSETDIAFDGALLGFNRHYASTHADNQVGLGQGWRHSYAVWLSSNDGGGREIIDSAGRRLLFEPPSDDAPGIYSARLATDGYLIKNDTVHTWVVPDGRRLRFHGSYLVRIEWPGHRFLVLHYTDRLLDSITDETSRVLRLEYTPGRRTSLRGYKKADFTKHAGFLAALVRPDGQRIRYDYDHRRNLTRVRFPDGTARQYHYENESWPNHLTGLTERTGKRFATWTYDDEGLAVSSTHANGVEKVMLAVEASSTVGELGSTTITNTLGATSRYTWRQDPHTGAGLLLHATGPGCATCPPTGRRYTYDAQNRLASETLLGDDEQPVSARHYQYDDRSRLVRIDETFFDTSGTSVKRLVENREYDGDSHRVAVLARPSVATDTVLPVNTQGGLSATSTSYEHQTETRFNADGQPAQIIERGFTPEFDLTSGELTGYSPIQRTSNFQYDSGRLVAMDGPRLDVDDITTFKWDAQQRLTAIHPPASPTVRITDFDANGYPKRLQMGSRQAFELTRDDEGRITHVLAGGEFIRYSHDAEGRLQTITDTDGRITRYTHDDAGRVASQTDDLGRVTTLVHDGESRLTERSQFGMDGRVINSLAYLFDAKGRLTQSTETRTDASGQSYSPRILEHAESTNGLTKSQTDPTTGVQRDVSLDLVSRLVTLSDTDHSVTRIALDSAGRHVALTDARNNTTRTPTDDFGRRVMLDSPDTGRTLIQHDAAGNRIVTRHQNGTEATYRYDAANRLIVRQDTDGTTQWSWDHASGTLLSATNENTAESFGYNNEARLTAHVREMDGHRFETRYQYDTRGRITEKTLPDGQVLVHHYHQTGPNQGALRAITKSQWLGLAQQTVVGEIDRDARDGSTSYLSAGGVRTEEQYAANGELSKLTLTDTLKLQYQFDEHGRIVGIDTNGVASQYGYDGGRLSFANTALGQRVYRYDSVGNRIASLVVSHDGDVSTQRYEYSTAGNGNQLLKTIDEQSGLETAYQYATNNGAPTAIGKVRYIYNAQKRPIEVWRDDALVARYAYNAFGERVKKVVHTANGTPRITYFLYDGSTLSAEVDEQGKIDAQYLYLDGYRPIAKLSGEHVFGIHGDHLGSPRVMTDGNGQPVWQADYTPFGEAAITLEKETLPLRLPGQYADDETGTHYNYFRDYDPTTGRYQTSDPIGLAGGVNTYGYVSGMPLAGIDPLGLFELPPPGSPLYQRLVQAGIISAADGPAPFGDAIAVAFLLVHFVDYGISGITNQDLSGVDVTSEYQTLFQEVLRYNPHYGTHTPIGWQPTIDDVRTLAEELLSAQRRYIANAQCGPGFDQTAYDAARQAVNFATALAAQVGQQQTALDDFLQREFADYRANGGEIDSLVDWLAAGMPSASDRPITSESPYSPEDLTNLGTFSGKDGAGNINFQMAGGTAQAYDDFAALGVTPIRQITGPNGEPGTVGRLPDGRTAIIRTWSSDFSGNVTTIEIQPKPGFKFRYP